MLALELLMPCSHRLQLAGLLLILLYEFADLLKPILKLIVLLLHFRFKFLNELLVHRFHLLELTLPLFGLLKQILVTFDFGRLGL